MKEAQKRSDCPISNSLDIWGDKWSLLLIRDLMLNKKCTYKDFLNAEEGIATNILSARLATLEDNEIIEKVDNPGTKTRVFYKLTAKGIDLYPVLVEIMLWAEKYFAIPEIRKSMLREIKKDKSEYIKIAVRELKKV